MSLKSDLIEILDEYQKHLEALEKMPIAASCPGLDKDLKDKREKVIRTISTISKLNEKDSSIPDLKDIESDDESLARFIESQEPLGEEFTQVWDENVDTLYDK